MTDSSSPTLPEHFEQAAAVATPRRPVTIDIDADVLDWMQSQGVNMLTEVNGFLRFMMDTSEQKAAEFDPDAWEPGELHPAQPGLL